MNGQIQCRFWALLIGATVALGAWKLIPDTALDRTAFSTVVGGFYNPPWFISGRGTSDEPWSFKVFRTAAKADPNQVPLVVSLGDDPEGFFQSSPPAPIDLAVILSNLKRLGFTKAASGVVLAWETPDPIGLAALEKTMNGFDSLIVTAPLSRGAVSSVMPPAFRRASIPAADVLGDKSLLPLVNRVPMPGVVFGGDNVAAGFSQLESEATGNLPPLMAKWEDRIVFSFALLAVLQRLDCPVSDVHVKLGEFIRLGNSGRILPIDDYGRLPHPIKKTITSTEISAEEVVDGDATLFPNPVNGPILLRDDRTEVGPAMRSFSETLSSEISTLASDHGVASGNTHPRLAGSWETAILLTFVSILAMLPSRILYPSAWILCGLSVAAQWILFAVVSIWMPGLAMLAGVLSTAVARTMFHLRTPETASVLVEEPISLEDPAPESIPIPKVIPATELVSAPEVISAPEANPVPELVIPPEVVPPPELIISPEPSLKTTRTKRVASKEAPKKKAAAKKAAAKKVPAKKAAKKTTNKVATPRAPRTKKPPDES